MTDRWWSQAGISTAGVLRDPSQRSAVYAALHDGDGELTAAIADMDIFDNVLSPGHVAQFAEHLKSAPAVVMDANPPVETMQAVGEICCEAGVPLWFEPTSIPKSLRLLEAPAALKATRWLSPNLGELVAMAEAAPASAGASGAALTMAREVSAALESATGLPEEHTGTLEATLPSVLLALAGESPETADRRHVFVSLGASGLLWVDAVWLPTGHPQGTLAISAKHYPALPGTHTHAPTTYNSSRSLSDCLWVQYLRSSLSPGRAIHS